MTDSIFIHIPRTGGTVLKWCLNDKIQNLGYINRQDHRLATNRRAELGGEAWQTAYKFTIIRNPWERAVSMYHHRVSTLSFNEWFESVNLDQELYFCDAEGVVLVDDVFRHESLSGSIPTICERAGWPLFTLDRVVNETEHGHYRDYFTEHTKNIFSEFAEKYGYEYEHPAKISFRI